MKINRLIDYRRVWEKTLEYLSKLPEQVLKDPAKFYKYVYEPVRDTFFVKLLVEDKVEPPIHIAEIINSQKQILGSVKKQHKSILDLSVNNIDNQK